MMPLMGSLERILLGNPLGGSYTGSVKSMWEQGRINTDTGEEVSSETDVRSGYLDARENAYYTQRTIGWGTFDKISWYFYTSEKEFLGVTADRTWIALKLAPVNCAYIRLVISNDATSISPTDVPDITLEDRSIWGWKDPNDRGAIVSTKLVDIKKDHYYYQESNIVKGILYFDDPPFAIHNDAMAIAPESHESTYMYQLTENGATPTTIGDLVFEDRDVWGWREFVTQIVSTKQPIDKKLLSVIYTGDLKNTQVVLNPEGKYYKLPIEDLGTYGNSEFLLFINKEQNPGITAADMVNHGTWTVTFSDPVSEVWQSDGSVYYTPHNSEIQKGKILAITPPSSFKAVSLVVQDSTGQNSHNITGGSEVTLSESTEWVYLTVSVSENPEVNLTNIDSFREQWSYSYKEIPAPVEPHWEGENFVFSVSDIQVGKAWQKSGDDIILVDDAGAIALPIITNPKQKWRILITNASVGRDLNGVQIRKTGAGVTATACSIEQGSFYSFILPSAGDQLAIHWTNGAGTTAQQLYEGITITGSEG